MTGNCSAKSVRRGSQASGGNASDCWKPPSPPWPEDPVLDPGEGDIVEHQARDDLVDLEPRPQDPRDAAPRAAGERPAEHHHRHHHEGRGAGRQDREQDHGARAPGTQQELALGADVPQPHPEGERAGQAGEDEGRGLDQGVGQGADAPERDLGDMEERADRIAADEPQDDPADEQRDTDRGQGHHGREPARWTTPGSRRRFIRHRS